MSILLVEEPQRHVFSPVERTVIRIFDDSLRKLEKSLRSQAKDAKSDKARCLKRKWTGKEETENLFEVELDVSNFKPEELSVTIRGDELILEGSHDERSDDHGLVERRFVRKYPLPKDLNQDLIESHLSDKSILSVVAKKPRLEKTKPRTIPIQVSAPQEESPREQKTE